MSFVEELKRRNVFRVGIAYLLMAWVLLQAADFALDLVDAPNWVIQTLTVLAALGLPVALFFAWAFELTPEGVKREQEVDRSQSITPKTGRKLDRFIIVVLLCAVGVLLADRFVPQSGDDVASTVESSVGQETQPAAEPAAEKKSMAVLPFVAMSNGPDDEYFADGLTEEILNSLAQLPELLVASRTSSFTFKGEVPPIEKVASQLGVDHVLEGSVRRSGERLRVTAQLIRAGDGFHLWSNNYDSSSEDAIAVQEDIAEKVAGALNVVLDDDSRTMMQSAGLRDVEAFIDYQKASELFTRAHTGGTSSTLLADLKSANEQLEKVLERVPSYSRAWVMHADYYTHLLTDSAAGVEIEERFAADLDSAVERMTADYETAASHVTTEGEKTALLWDMAYLSGDWRGTLRRLKMVEEQGGCTIPQWGDMLSLSYGQVDGMLRRAIERAECDPHIGRLWSNVGVAYLWAEDPDSALDAFDRIKASGRGDHDVMAEAMAHIQRGDLDTAEQITESILSDEASLAYGRAMVAAARGKKEEIQRHLAQYLQIEQRQRIRELVLMAVMGDREGANSLAAEIDADPFGYITLPMAVNFCACGAPWEIEATPNFKARFEQTGLQWPPTTPLHFPLKDW